MNTQATEYSEAYALEIVDSSCKPLGIPLFLCFEDTGKVTIVRNIERASLFDNQEDAYKHLSAVDFVPGLNGNLGGDGQANNVICSLRAYNTVVHDEYWRAKNLASRMGSAAEDDWSPIMLNLQHTAKLAENALLRNDYAIGITHLIDAHRLIGALLIAAATAKAR